MSSCERFRQTIWDFYDDELDTFHKKELRHHLKICPQCAHFANQVRLLKSELRNLPPIKTSDGFQLLLRERIRRELAGKTATHFHTFSITKHLIPALGLVAIIAFSGYWLFEGYPPYSRPSPVSNQITQSSILENNDLGDRIQYVIDEYSDPLTVAKSDSQSRVEVARGDSVLQNKDMKDEHSRLTPVSF